MIDRDYSWIHYDRSTIGNKAYVARRIAPGSQGHPYLETGRIATEVVNLKPGATSCA